VRLVQNLEDAVAIGNDFSVANRDPLSTMAFEPVVHAPIAVLIVEELAAQRCRVAPG